MKIESSTISMSSRHSSIESHSEKESLLIRAAGGRPEPEGNKLIAGTVLNSRQGIIVEISDEAKSLLMQETGNAETVREEQQLEIGISEKDKQKMLIIQGMLEALTGKKIKFYLPEKIKLKPQGTELSKAILNTIVLQNQGWGLEYNYSKSHYEQEKLSFDSAGVIKTADGKEINFSVQLNMSREFASQENIRITAGKAVDPLVLNFNGAAPELTDTKFCFDLDSDGIEEQIYFVGPNSGFLALDQNGDGIINNGGELFGPQSGDGFAELARYDTDGNSWIDENDPIYDQLRIWTKDDQGRDQLFALGQKGIGAIYLGNIDTAFSFKNEANQLQGQLRKTGIYVNENGSVGTAQQIDLTI